MARKVAVSFVTEYKLPNITELGVFAEDTLPLNVRAYELPNITIYTAEYLYAYFCLPYKARMPADTTS